MYAFDENKIPTHRRTKYIMKKGFDKRFNNGDIVYWCQLNNLENTIKYGMVDTQFTDRVVIDYLSERERRRVNGIPFDEFESEERYKKLPKNWNYNTRLYEITYDKLSDEEEVFLRSHSFKNPSHIKEAYDRGYLVKDKTIWHGTVDAEITKQGYRIIKKYLTGNHHISNTSVMSNKVYFTYEEAEQERNYYMAELKRQSSLSDYEWSLEDIDNTINRWRKYYGAPVEHAQAFHDWFVSMDKVEDIETRLFNGHIQWKYWKNKKWNYVELL